MKCDICKVREAVFFVQEVNKDTSIELHYCEECALKKGLLINKNSSQNTIKTVMAKIADNFEKNNNSVRLCRFCGTTESSVIKTGKVGCSYCYNVFANLIRKDSMDNKKIRVNGNGNTATPLDSNIDIQDIKDTVLTGKIEILQKRLEEAVNTENYEEAAVLRDKINELKKNNL